MASPQNKHAQDRPSNNARRLALRYTQPFNLDDWQKAQSAEREQLLHDFDFRRSLPDVPILQHIRPASGNGDVATDVSIARRHYAMTGERLLLEVVKDVYGVMDLYCGFVDFPPRAEDFTKPYWSQDLCPFRLHNLLTRSQLICPQSLRPALGPAGEAYWTFSTNSHSTGGRAYRKSSPAREA